MDIQQTDTLQPEATALSAEPSVAHPAPVEAPVSRGERITSLDALRGFALLGILLMNIIPFSMYGGAYDNPTVTGGPATGANLAVWAVLHVLARCAACSLSSSERACFC
jgi:uncharacterized membrane protein YeiB